MLAVIARAWHLAELILLVAFGVHLVRGHDWAWYGAAAAVLGLAVGWRLMGNALVYAVACWRDVPRPTAYRVSLVSRIALVLREAQVFTLAYAWYQMWPARYARALPGRPTADRRRIVLLVHGYFCNAGVWAWFVPHLEAAGFHVQTVSLEPLRGSIEANADRLNARLSELRSLMPDAPVALVCHSMGGLVVRSCFERHGLAAVDQVITLGTPHHGTVIAAIALGTNGAQMRAGSPWMQAAPGARLPEVIRTTTVLTWDDNLVSPRESALLGRATPVQMAGVGHLSMVASPKVIAVVLASLRQS